MQPIQVQSLTPDNGPIVGFALVAHENIIASEPAKVSDLQDELEVPFVFYRGDLNEVRAQLHKHIDDAIDALSDAR